jgi:hypothetical protein
VFAIVHPHELVQMVEAARLLADARARGDATAITEGEQVFAFSLVPGPQQGKALLAAHLLMHCMDDVDRRRTIEAPAAPAPAAAVAGEPAAAPAAPPAPRACPEAHPDDMPCEACEEEWGKRQAAKRAAPPPSSSSSPSPSPHAHPGGPR